MFRRTVMAAALGVSAAAMAQDTPVTPKLLAEIEALTAAGSEAGDALAAFRKIAPQRSPVERKEGLRALHDLGERGDLMAALLLGMTYRIGLSDLPADPVESLKWYRRVAESTAPFRGIAAGWVGQAYLFGRGTAENAAEAARWLRVGAEAGDPEAMEIYGILLVNGRGVHENIPEAIRWLEPAAAKGQREAMTVLAGLYDSGDGVPEDKRKALELWEAAATKGSGEAAFRAALGYRRGPAANPAKAFHYAAIAAGRHLPRGMALLGAFYLDGVGTPVDLQKAAEWSRLAADTGESFAMVSMARIAAQSDGTLVSRPEGASWVEKAAAKGNSTAQAMLGGFYEYGVAPLTQDRAKAIALYRASAAQGDEKAKAALDRLGEKP